MKILIPEGYEMPEDIVDGSTLEELVTFTVDGNYLVPTAIAGIEIPADAEKAEEEEEAYDEGVAAGEEEAAPEGKKLKGRAASMAAGSIGSIGRRIMGGMAMA